MKDKIKIIQGHLGVNPGGYMDDFTVDKIYRMLEGVTGPYHAKFYGQDFFITTPDKVEPFDGHLQGVGSYGNCISGSFSWIVDGRYQPVSVLIQEGRIVCPTACHATDIDMPESVLWYDGSKMGVDRIKHVKELDNLKEIKWAIGGLGLVKNGDYDYYDNKAEGFTGPFSDVLRKTSHMIVGCDEYSFIAIGVKKMDINQIRSLIKKVGLKYAVMLDGGHLTAWNFGDNVFRKWTRQRYMIQLRR